MTFDEKLQAVQKSLREQNIEGWLLYDFRRSNSLAQIFLEIPTDTLLTRRLFYWIPQQGTPIKILSSLEAHVLNHLPGEQWTYKNWQELEKLLFSIEHKKGHIAMEYSPSNALPVVSKVDAGMVEWIQKGGGQVVSSANLLQRYTAVWSEEQVQSHLAAADVLNEIVDHTWAFITQAITSKTKLNEYQVQQFMLNEMQKQGCVTEHAPICAVNVHSSNPHYEPHQETASLVERGDWILLDLWCKQKHPHAVYADITRVGVAALEPTPQQQIIFQIVKKAQEIATQFVRDRYEKSLPIQAWEVDQVCRDYINQEGYGEFFIHRTGHNIGEELHGSGANLDNFETHDFRELLPGTCFSIEPGIYLPQQFGVRLEYDVYLDYAGHLLVTGGIQKEIACLKI